MQIDIQNGKLDMRPGGLGRMLVQAIMGPNWEDYVTIYIKSDKEMTPYFSDFYLHNEDGPAAVKQDGSMEWWLKGQKLFVTTQQEFEVYMRNKAFW